jgi:hypothetical protein
VIPGERAEAPVVRRRRGAGGPALCRHAGKNAVADLASDLDLPIGVVRVLIGDLMNRGLVSVSAPAPVAYARDERVLRTVLDELNSL